MRVFPRGTRIGSSNVDPTFHWRQGAQMVALNWQRIDKGMMLNQAMFAGTQGWVLKPEGYRTKNQSQGQADHSLIPKKGLLELKIQLLSAQDLPLPQEKDHSHRSKMKPYVTLQLHVDTHGPPGQGKSSGNTQPRSESDAYGEDEKGEKKYKRRSKTARSDSPNFEGETMSWSGVTDVVDELSFVRYVASLFCLLLLPFGKIVPGSCLPFQTCGESSRLVESAICLSQLPPVNSEGNCCKRMSRAINERSFR